MNIKIDLYNDWIEILRSELLSFGYNGSTLVTQNNVTLTYFNLKKRLIEQRPRKILKSQEFTCPTEIKDGLALAEEAIIQGNDLLPHLSKRIKKPGYNDPLLNHWGIHHLHLGSTMDSDGFMRQDQDDLLLFAKFTNDYAYLINILPHGVWAEQELVRIIHKNWPESIHNFRVARAGISRTYHQSDDDVAKLRKAKINICVEAEPGIEYFPLGGGVSHSGISIDVVDQSIRYKNSFISMEKALVEQIDTVMQAAINQNITLPETPEFTLSLRDGVARAVETATNFVVSFWKP